MGIYNPLPTFKGVFLAGPTHMNARSLAAVVFSIALAVLCAVPGKAFGEDAVRVRAVAQRDAVAPGDLAVIAIVMDHAEGYHTWPAKHVELPSDVNDFAIRTEIELAGPAEWVANPVSIQWPETKVYDLPSLFEEGKRMNVALYSGRAVAFLVAQAPDAAGKHTLSVRVAFQACDDTACLMPEDQTLSVEVTVGSAQSAEVNEPALFAAFDPSKSDGSSASPPAPSKDSAAVAPAENRTAEAKAESTPTSEPAAPANGSFFGLNLGSGLIALTLFAILGGFLLNLTPCVLPVIPIKVMTLTSHASSPTKAMMLGIYMALGVVAFWLAIGIPMAFVSANLDPSKFIFGVWWVTLSIGLVIAIMGLGIMGLFNLNLPQAVYMIDAKADSPGGSFLFGVLTAVLGLPCFGFVAGGLLAGAATLPPLTIMAIFGGLGVGMAAPYLVLSAKPSLLRFIPRTGPASELVKQVMGLLLMAAAAYFLAAGIKAAILDRPYLVGSIGWWAVGFFVAIAGLWLTIRTLQIAKSAWPRVVMPLVAVVMVAGIGVFANDKLGSDYANYQAKMKARAVAQSGDVPTGVWLDFSPELFKAVRASGKPVFLDFTADWCINCKVFKSLILSKDPTLARLANSNAVLMEVDCTSTNAAGWEMLKELGRTGLPTWVLYGAEQGPPIVLDLTKPTHATIKDGLERAGIKIPALPTSTAAR